MIWSYKNVDYVKLNDMITNTDWGFLDTASVDETYIPFSNIALTTEIRCSYFRALTYMNECIHSNMLLLDLMKNRGTTLK